MSVKKSIYVLMGIFMLVSIAGCVQSKYKTRTFMTDEEKAKVDEIYHPKTPEEVSPVDIGPFLSGIEGTAIKVNGLDVPASEIRELYYYLAGNGDQDLTNVKRQVCMTVIQTYAAMSQWPETLETAREKATSIKGQAMSANQFRDLVVENSQEPGADQLAGELTNIEKNMMALPFEMRAFTAPVGQVVGPFATIFGWHLLQVIERDDNDPNSKPTVRHLLLFHGLKPENGDIIREKVEWWTRQAKVEVFADELYDILPDYVRRPTEDASSGDAPVEPPA